MAKKKRKYLIKLNNKIRNYFGGLPFDEGVATLDVTKLTELVMLLGLELGDASKEEMVRALRRVWSEEGAKARELIVAYLTGNAKALRAHEANSAGFDKVEKIVSLLSELPHTREEEEMILERFLDVKAEKITIEKIQNTLHYLRMKRRISSWERELELHFNTLAEPEFTHPFLFDMPEEQFHKLLLCVGDPVDLDALQKEDDETVIEALRTQKAQIIAEKEAQIKEFIAPFYEKAHPFLTHEEATRALKRMPIDAALEQAPLPLEIVERCVRSISEKYTLYESGDHFIVEKERHYTLFETPLPYRISVSYEKRFVYARIWQGELPDIKAELNEHNDEVITRFEAALSDLREQMETLAEGLSLEAGVFEEFILRFVEPQVRSNSSLRLKEKLKRRILYHFGEYVKPLLEQKKREALLAQTIRDFKQLFPLARSLHRKIVFHVGPTNSGKTYAALQRLKSVESGYYLAPLRLLALEGYEKLRDEGVNCSLITGEEEIIDEESTHISSTIEMMNPSVEVECCVIDEIQMIADRDRGWAWANALIGAPAKEIILTGSEDAIEAVEALCAYLQEPLEIVRFERKNPLEVLRRPMPINAIKPQSAVVAFSRKEVLALKQQLSRDYSVSVVYGNLSPEVRREEARRFREGESEILVATDAIAMGLNLPIRTILFAKDNKFDGLKRRELLPSEVMQIAGRAGRYGIEEKGFVGALDYPTLKTIDRLFHTPLEPIALPVAVMANLEHVLLIGEILQTENLSEILGFFADNMEFEGPFVAANIESMLEIAAIVDAYRLDLRTRYHLACAPAGISSPYIEQVFHRYIRRLEADEVVRYQCPGKLPKAAITNEMLLRAEDQVREISLYLWLSFKFPDKFPDTEAAIAARAELNAFIERSLHYGNFSKACRKCGKALDFSYRYSICDACYAKKRNYVRKHRHTKR